MARNLFLLAHASAFLPTVSAWGAMGHETVALIAQNYVKSATASWAQNILGSTSATYMADVSTWADSYRYTSAGSFSAPYHYIDAEDNPPSSCGVDYNRDCGSSGCSVSAIANYTNRVSDSTLSSSDHFDALRFIIHFIGDLHQPLHDEAINVGGNTISVKFNGSSTNLHHIWDTEIPQTHAGGSTMATAQSYSASLINSIDSGNYDTNSWISGTSVSQSINTMTAWANDANKYVCSVVMPNGVSGVSGKELSGAYYQSCISTVDLQLAKAGYRLAAWLDIIATGSTSLGGGASSKAKRGELFSWELPSAANDMSEAKIARRLEGFFCKH